MSEKLFRCGACGRPTTSSGEPLVMSQSEIERDLKRWNEAEYIHGNCCASYPQQWLHGQGIFTGR